MDENDRELLRHLFAVATEIAESAHDAAANGQAAHLATRDYANLADQLRTAARNIAALSEAASIIATRSAETADSTP